MAKPMKDLELFTVEEVKERIDPFRVPVTIAVYGTENYFNLGGIIRLGHNFLVKEIICIDLPKHYKRADMGARKYESIIKTSLADFRQLYANRNIISCEMRFGLISKDIRYYQYPEDPIILFGSEKFGVPSELLNMSIDIISVPVFGVQNDHNVNVVTGMVLYDFCVKNPQYYNTRPLGDLPSVN